MNTTKQLLERDLQNCKSLIDIEYFKEILKHSHKELSAVEIVDLFNNMNYKKAVIEYATRYKENRYPACTIWRFFQDAKSYLQCDAILFHIEKKYSYYTQKYIDKTTLETFSPLSNTDVFTRMAKKRKANILTELVTL